MQQKREAHHGTCSDCGERCSAESTRCIRCHARALAKKQIGEAHGLWKGGAATYTEHHHWIKRWGTRSGSCAHCDRSPDRCRDGRVGTDWANISGRYLRQVDDWIELCRSCHKLYDMRRIRGE
jgi:hypothetical protein